MRQNAELFGKKLHLPTIVEEGFRTGGEDTFAIYQRADGSYILHRVKAVTSQGLTLWGDNHTMLEYGVTEAMIIGCAARIFRGEKELNCQSIPYRVYLWLWQFKAIRNLVLPFAYHLRKEKNK